MIEFSRQGNREYQMVTVISEVRILNRNSKMDDGWHIFEDCTEEQFLYLTGGRYIKIAVTKLEMRQSQSVLDSRTIYHLVDSGLCQIVQSLELNAITHV